MPILGVDLGTTNSLCAVWHNGKCELVPNCFSEYLTPSVVGIDDDDTLLIGKIAKERLISHPELTASLFKRHIGTDYEYQLDKKIFSPEELSALVLRQLREDAELFIGEEITEAVISVPAYFNDHQRSATKRAGALAGLKVERLVNEPSAAALACYRQSGNKDDYCNYLVFDFGGGTLDVSIVECFDDIVNILAVSGNNRLGGSDFDLEIAKYFCQQNNLDYEALPSSAKASLLRQAELSKFELSNKNSIEMTVKTSELSGSIIVGNQKLIEICAGLLKSMDHPVRRVLADSGLSPEDIKNIILVGGSCHMPVVKQYLWHVFNIRPAEYVSPDTAVAMGLGIYVGIKERQEEIKDVLLTDICPFSLGTGVYNKNLPSRPLMSVLIERNSTLPASKVERYYPVHENQTDVRIGIYQGEAMYVDDNILLGDLMVPVMPKNKDEAGIDVRFTYDINGILEVEAKTYSMNRCIRRIIVSKGSGMTPAQAERRMQELASLKVHPRDEEENRLLLARAERLYTETVGVERENIQHSCAVFSAILQKQDRLQISKVRKEFCAFLDRIDGGENSTEASLFRFDDDGDKV